MTELDKIPKGDSVFISSAKSLPLSQSLRKVNSRALSLSLSLSLSLTIFVVVVIAIGA